MECAGRVAAGSSRRHARGRRAGARSPAGTSFYNQSKFDGNDATANANDDAAIATDKSALLPGGTASFANYTSYSRGLNGIMVDIANLPAGAVLSASDFGFKVGNTDTPSAWANLAGVPTVSMRPVPGGPAANTRVTLIWPTGAAIKQWLQVTVKANGNTGLTMPDVFYFGNAVGESGNVAGDYSVSITDEIIARNNPVSINPGTTVHQPVRLQPRRHRLSRRSDSCSQQHHDRRHEAQADHRAQCSVRQRSDGARARRVQRHCSRSGRQLAQQRHFDVASFEFNKCDGRSKDADECPSGERGMRSIVDRGFATADNRSQRTLLMTAGPQSITPILSMIARAVVMDSGLSRLRPSGCGGHPGMTVNHRPAFTKHLLGKPPAC